MNAAELCIVVKGFPRVSETFITRELEELESRGVKFSIASLRRPTKDAGLVSDHKVQASVSYLPEYLHEEPARVFRGIQGARRFPGFAAAWAGFRQDFARDLSRNRIRRFGQACVLAHELTAQTRHLHAHFIHTPSSVARYAALIRQLTFSISAHAKDVWTTPDWDLRQKLSEARFCCTCNAAACNRLHELEDQPRVQLWPHIFMSSTVGREPDAAPDNVVRLLTVARAVPKKGLETLLDALALLPAEPAWTWTHIGGGEDREKLLARAKTHHYANRLTLLGAQSHATVLSAMRKHYVFVLPATVADNGDRDGRPNALLEAMSAGLACVATAAGGIPEIISNGQEGLIVESNPQSLATALSRVIADRALRQILSTNAIRRAAALAGEGETAIKFLVEALNLSVTAQ